jgi:hypothetical protein
MASAQEFFAVSAGVAGALIGLLFVAISVAPERVLGPEAQEVHAVRAAAALTAFVNALAVSLFSLIPGLGSGGVATAVAVVGLLFMLGALVRLIPLARAGEIHWRELSFLAGLLVVFVIQLLTALKLDGNEQNHDAQQTICILVAICFLLGIARAWELVGGPHVSVFNVLVRGRRGADEPEEL